MFQATDEQMLASVRDRIRQLHEYAPDSIGDRMGYQLISCTGGPPDPDRRCFFVRHAL